MKFNQDWTGEKNTCYELLRFLPASTENPAEVSFRSQVMNLLSHVCVAHVRKDGYLDARIAELWRGIQDTLRAAEAARAH